MNIRPERGNAQFQPLTIVLRNIIREYPAGGGVLRELAQNADDAGASEIVFVLDRRQHPTQDILHGGLAEFQGISLLAFNNSVFSDVDFESLSRIGDSAKAKDPNSTGKFGRGFNSVYNWTDTPSILSRSSLLILDPHQTWSASPEVGQPGGPVYDFVKYSQEPKMRNQLVAFSSITQEFDSGFDGTIIRLPLRTQSQAAKSKIIDSGKPTTGEDIIDIFRKFSGELVETLLFLKNLHTITLKIGDKEYAKAVSTTHSFSDAQGGSFDKASINAAYKRVFVEKVGGSCSMDFVMDISLRIEENDESYNDQKFKFAISHHLRQGLADNDLEKWSRSRKLFPWVAIATPLEGYTEFEGRLFSTLPLPIRAEHPVHIHGMFSITPDRNTIHSGGDWTIGEDSEAKWGTKWNQWLLHECLPNTWIQNLEFVRTLNERKEYEFSGWNFWPAGNERASGELWMGVLGEVFKRVAGRNLELLPTVRNTVGRRTDIIFALEIPTNLASALQHAGVPVVIPPESRRYEIESLRPYTIGLRPLEPNTARACLSKLKDSSDFKALTLDSRVILLQYILSDEDFRDIGSCTAPLVPLVDSMYASFDFLVPHVRSVFLARDDDEARLFGKYKKMIDTSRIPPKTTKLMRKYIFNGRLQRFTKISAWEIDDVARYCGKYVFNKPGAQDSDIICIQRDDFVNFVNQLWKWISRYCKLSEVASSSLKGLFLLPLVDGEYRRLDSAIPVLDVSANRGIGAFLQSTAISHSRNHGRRFHLFTGIGFPPHVGDSLRKCGFVKDYEDIMPLMGWLVANSESFVDQLSKSEKILLLQHLNALSRSNLDSNRRKSMGEAIAMLSLFQEAVPNRASDRPWISIRDRGISYVGVKDIPVQLQAIDTIFIDISNPDTEQIVTRMQLAVCPQPTNLFEGYVIPGLAALDEGLRVSHGEYVLRNYHALSPKSKEDLSQTEIVPVQCSPNKTSLKRPRDTVDPNSVAASLYFEDENKIPVEGFYSRYHTRLRELGMIEAITSEVVLDRISEYGQRGGANHPLDEIAAKVQQMMIQCRAPPSLSQEIIQSLKWIPAHDLGGKMELFSVIQCRDRGREMLVKYVMPLVKFSVNSVWAKRFGWDQPLPKSQLLEQLKGAVNAEDNKVVEYLIGSRELEACITELLEMKWIPSIAGGYYSPSTIFFDDFQALSPHFGTLEHRLGRLGLFGRLGVHNAPSLLQFKELQDQLARKGVLENPDLEKAIFVVTEVGKRFPDRKNLYDFKAPDRHGRMHLMSELTAGDPGNADVDLQILHPGVSLDTVKKLGISTFHDRYLELLNDPYFEGEFAQRESPTAFIEDTLRRYPISSTFSEYLANAEDCGKASMVCWFLDAADDYPKTSLLSPQLAEVQGPALFCYNDGVFTEDDFRGIVNIGFGSKSTNPSNIGKFGKGALTMYHWTSVPSFISGDYYVIFDPEQKYLPEHPRTKRPRAGMKFKIENIREQCPDQLQPFEGITKFGKDSKSFPGTLFRFPLRRSDALAHGKITIFEARKYLEDYYHEATTSLLFLKEISSISFWDKCSKDPVWKVTSKVTIIPNEPHITSVTIKRRLSSIPVSSNDYDKWCIITSRNSNTEEIPSQLVNIMAKERLEAKYGLAALLNPEWPGDFCARQFVGLPLQSVSKLGLPVHVNADIIIESSRKSIPIREKEEGSAWNRWIYEFGVAPLYLDLVRYLMQIDFELDSNGYRYWPEYPSITIAQNKITISGIISMAFWRLIASSSYPLYRPMRLPSASATISGHIPRNLSLKASIFNLLSSKDSEFMLPLLSKLGVENIVTPNQMVRNGLGGIQPPSLSSITPAYFITHLRSSPVHFQNILLEIWAQENNYSMDFFNSVLSFITHKTELTSLIDCALLPLANLTLGTFFPKGGNENFLVAETSEEQGILEISQNLMVRPGLDPALLQRLISSGQLNITRFTFNDITRLRPILEDSDVEYRRKWLVKVWTYLRNNHSHLPEPQLACLGNMPMYFGKTIGGPADEHTFFCPSDLENFKYPVILEQSGLTKDVLLVLESLTGLILLDKSAFPESKLSQESIKSVTGLYRLLRSIDLLASKNGLFVEEYIIKTIPSRSIETLRDLFPPTILSGLLKKYLPSKEYLLQFPIWPVGTSVHHPATKALLPPFPKLSLLGMTKSDVFIETNIARKYSRELEHLGVKKMTLDVFLRNHVGVCLGHEISLDKKSSYPALVRVLLDESPDACSRYPIGVDGNGRFCMLDSLYAFNVPVFAAAFRDLETTCFLHPDYRNMEMQQSLIQKTVTESRYLSSARSIQRRVTERQTEDHDLMKDARTVFEYLSWDTPEMRVWSSVTWRDLSKIAFVPTQTLAMGTPEHRRSRMLELSGDAKFTTFVDGILLDYVDIAWSQCPILHNQPSSFVLGKIPARGIPSPNNVLSHLMFLSNNRYTVTKAQIPDYIKDIKASYMHLLRVLVVNGGIGTGAGAGPIWFNVEVEEIPLMSTDEFQASWTDSHNLCLGLEYDSLPLQRVRSFLTPFQELLGNFGIRKLKGPVVPTHAPRITDHNSLVLKGFQRLRNERRSFDVNLVAQGQVFQAHWILLSAVSRYWDGMSASGMIETTTRTVEFPEIRPKTLSILLDYIYSGQWPVVNLLADVRNELEDIIDQLYAADLWGLDDLKAILEHTLCDKHWIRPETVLIVLNCAEEVRAKTLVEVCKQYIRDNSEIIQREHDL